MSSESADSGVDIIHLPPIEIVSPDNEVSLRQYVPEDAKEGFALIDRNRKFLSQYEEDTPAKYPDLESFLESIVHPNNPSRLRFGIRNKAGVLVGSINLTPQAEDPHRGEIGYYLGEEFQHHGYVSRAIIALSNYAFQSLDYDSLFGNVHPDNEPSLNALKRAGFIDLGVTNEKGRKILTRVK